jgi:hypothetical protein
VVVGLVGALFAFGAIGHYGFVRDGWPARAAAAHYTSNQDQLVRLPSMDDECTRYVGEKPLFQYCRYTNAHAKTAIAVIGDSHAHVAYPGIAALARERGMSTVMLAHSGCPFDSACTKATEQMLTTVGRDSTIDKVFVFCRCPHYLAESRIGPEALRVALQSTIDALRATGKHVFLVSDPPELPFSPAACLPRPLRSTTRTCEVDIGAVRQFQLGYSEVLRNLRDVTIIQTVDAFCPNGTCRAVRGDELLYADDNHLSEVGSRFLASEVLRPVLQ